MFSLNLAACLETQCVSEKVLSSFSVRIVRNFVEGCLRSIVKPEASPDMVKIIIRHVAGEKMRRLRH